MTFIPDEAKDYIAEVSLGNFDDREGLTFTSAGNVSGTEGLVWPSSQTGLASFLQAPATLQIESANINDTALGTGARTVFIEGLNLGVITSEVIIMNGQTSVNTVNQYDRVNTMAVVDVGTYGGNNIGVITLSDGAIDMAVIGSTRSIAYASKFTVPVGKVFILKQIIVNTDTDKAVDFFLRDRHNYTNVIAPFEPAHALSILRSAAAGTTVFKLEDYAIISALTDVFITATASQGSPVCTVIMQGELRDA